MAKIIYGSQQLELTFSSNQALADIQSIAHARFSKGLGFFLTMAGVTDSTGDESSTAYWFHPSIPLMFRYDVRDEDTDEYIVPIEVDQDVIARCVTYCDEPLGVLVGYQPEGPFLPFAPPPEASSASPLVAEDVELPAEERF